MPRDSFRKLYSLSKYISTALAFWKSRVKYRLLQVEMRKTTCRSQRISSSLVTSPRESDSNVATKRTRTYACQAIRTQAGGATQSSRRRVEYVSYTWYAANTSPSRLRLRWNLRRRHLHSAFTALKSYRDWPLTRNGQTLLSLVVPCETFDGNHFRKPNYRQISKY